MSQLNAPTPEAPGPRRALLRKRLRNLRAVRTRGLVTAIAVPVVVTVAGLGLTYFLTEQTGCEVGKAVVTNERLETPLFGRNAPYMGTAATMAYVSTSPAFLFESGSLTVRSQPLTGVYKIGLASPAFTDGSWAVPDVLPTAPAASQPYA
jgi:hypothetical protein